MSAPKHRARVDENQKDIVDALKKIGCTVETIGKPVDLLVGYRAHNFLIEVKNPDTDYGKNDRGTEVQDKFIAGWQGQIRKVTKAEEAIRLVSNAYGFRDCTWKITDPAAELWAPSCGRISAALISPHGIDFCPWCGGRVVTDG